MGTLHQGVTCGEKIPDRGGCSNSNRSNRSWLLFDYSKRTKSDQDWAYFPLTGDAAVYGEWDTQGIELAVEEINANGGVNGMQIKVIHEDDQLDPKTAASALNKLITVDKVPAVIGADASSVTLAIAPIAEKNHVVLITPESAAISISNAGDYIFRVFPSNAAEGTKLVELASNLNITNGAILYINNDSDLNWQK